MIAQRVREAVIDHLAMPAESRVVVSQDTALRKELHAEAFELEDLATDLEARFNITISEDEMAAAQTVGDLVKLVEGKVK